MRPHPIEVARAALLEAVEVERANGCDHWARSVETLAAMLPARDPIPVAPVQPDVVLPDNVVRFRPSKVVA